MKSKIAPILITFSIISSGIFSGLVALGGTARADIRGVDSDVKGSISDVNGHTKDVFKQLGIATTASGTGSSGVEQTLEGKKGDMDVQVEMKQTSENQTHVGVLVKQGTLKWNKDYAQNVLSKIVQAG
jgi:hypothetical protein